MTLIILQVKRRVRGVRAMRASQEDKQRSRQRILEGAARLMRKRGIEGASVADVMAEAGMTHGGFYRHFDTKDALLAEALEAAFGQMMSELDRRLGEGKPEEAVAGFKAFYLSQGHVDQPGIGCPAAAVVSDAGRGSDALKATFGAGIRRMAAAMAEAMEGPAQTRRASAMRELAMLAGAVAIARASDPETARDVLAACRASSGDADP